ncbi:MAG: hypothetical protein NWF00_06675 [Candidatus Bathyarchaeota archaeon]|nr:hypothetical protein [Candidatus Bathyarchaeota archaeon]
MSSVPPAKTRIEIYRAPAVFFDHFCSSGWVATPLGGAALAEDTVTLTIQAGEVVQNYAKACSFDADLFPSLVVRVYSLTATEWQVWLQQEIGGAWVKVAYGSEAGLFEVDLSGVFSGGCTGVVLVAAGSAGQEAVFDLVCVCKEFIVPADGDVVGQLEISWTRFNDAVTGAKFKLLSKAAYEAIYNHDAVVIYLGRSGESGVKRFGGRVRRVLVDSVRYGEEYRDIWCHGHGCESQTPPSRFTHNYGTATNGRTIIEAALALCAYLARHPTDSYWFDAGGSTGSTDDRILSDHTVDFDCEQPFKVMQQIAEDADNGVTPSFDLYETPSGLLVGHSRNSLDFVCGTTPSLRRCMDNTDSYPVANRVTVYGARRRSHPADGDEWTLDDVGNWTALYGTLSEGTDNPTEPLQGSSNYLRCSAQPDGEVRKSSFKRTLPASVSGMGKAGYSKYNFALYISTVTYPKSLTSAVVYLKTDASNYFYYTIDPSKFEDNRWNKYSLALGPNNEYSLGNPTGVWKKTGSPDWTNLNILEWYFEFSGDSLGVCLDGLNFGDGAFRATANHVASQLQPWGIVEAAPQVDTSFNSDTECSQRGNAILAERAYPQRMIDPITVDGHADYKPTLRVYVKGDWYVLNEVVDIVKDNQWTAELKI